MKNALLIRFVFVEHTSHYWPSGGLWVVRPNGTRKRHNTMAEAIEAAAAEDMIIFVREGYCWRKWIPDVISRLWLRLRWALLRRRVGAGEHVETMEDTQ
jgi:hypothetical protein